MKNYPAISNSQVLAPRPLPAEALPGIVAAAGPAAGFAWEEFFQGEIANHHTRKNYLHAVRKFLVWANNHGLELTRINPGEVGRYFHGLNLAVPTKKLHLAALRKFFDRLVNRHVLILNPAATVRAERYTAIEGKTPEMRPEQARALLESIATTNVVGLRDKAVLAVLIFTAARVGAVARLTRVSLRHDGTQYTLCFQEKGGKAREIPVRHDVEQFLLDYLAAANVTDGPLFRTVAGRTKALTARPMTGIDMCRMMKRRLEAAGLPTGLSPHSLRVLAVTDLLSGGVPLADVQYLAGHADPRTTRLYDRRQQRVTRNVVERISV